MPRPRVRRGIAALAAGAVGVATAAAVGASGAGVSAAPARSVDRLPAVTPAAAGHIDLAHRWAAPPTTATCEAQIKIACYSPLQLQQAYNVKKVFAQGLTGAGRTIAVVDSFGSPTIQADLRKFDADFGLPDPNLSIIQPAGPVPAYDPTDTTRQGWAFESTLDVEYAHAMAPGANILLVETPVAETEGNTGLPEMMDAEQYVAQHKLADVISQSFGATENTFSNPARDLPRLEYAFKAAARRNITVLASSGDAGATDAQLDGATDYPYRVNSWPSSDPLVTSVGGTQLFLDAKGNRTKRDVVWNDGYGAGGGGTSLVFGRPSYQDSVKGVVGAKRGTPDISLSAAVDGGALVYITAGGISPGYHIVGGTSEASPLLAGIVALAAQAVGHGVGQLNPRLYAYAAQQGYGRSGLVDVTQGNNSFDGVKGYRATKGYDLASGLGTVDAYKVYKALTS